MVYTIKNIEKLIYLSLMLVFVLTLSGCKNHEPKSGQEDSIEEHKESTVLLYAVATNSLEYNLISDKLEIIEGAKEIDLKHNNILLLQTVYNKETNPKSKNIELLRLKNEQDSIFWDLVQKFDTSTDMLDPIVMKDLISQVTSDFNSDTYGLIFWSHSTASQPYMTETRATLPEDKSFGQDLLATTEENIQINIEDLAEALPNNVFKYIWFDSCYMSNIETLYQLRNKCDTFVGYPTEVLDSGLPYHLIVKYLIGRDPQLIEAAKTFYEYYSLSFGTIAVIDMSNIEILADFCSNIYMQGNEVYSPDLFKYTRYSTGPFYDLGDYTKAMAIQAGFELGNEEWNEILDEVVIYKAATERDLTYKTIDPAKYSGISTHLYQFDWDSENEKYYTTLDWYKRVF